MRDERTPQEDNGTSKARVRLAWRWKESGQQGAGPWSHRADVVETLADTMNQRFHERMDHWVEAERDVRV